MSETRLPETGFVTSQLVRKRYAISNSTLYLWIAQNRFPKPYKIGERAVRFRVDDLRAFEANLTARDELTHRAERGPR